MDESCFLRLNTLSLGRTSYALPVDSLCYDTERGLGIPLPSQRKDGKAVHMKPFALAIDLDGVIYRGTTPVLKAAESIHALQNADVPFCFVTNNSEHHPDYYIEKLASLGVHINPLQLLSASQVLAAQLLRHHNDERIYCIGTPGLRTFLTESGLELSQSVGNDRPDTIVVGEVRSLDYEMLCTAVYWVQQGATIHATNSDRVIPHGQRALIGCGAITQLLAEAAGVEAMYYGKPSHHMAMAISDRLEAPLNEIIMVGDTLETDIRLAADHGMQSVLVLTGNTKANEAKSSSVQASFVIQSIGDLEHLLHIRDGKTVQ